MNTETVAEFAAGTNWESIPGAVRAHARQALADTFGCSLAGQSAMSTQAAYRAALRLGASSLPMKAFTDAIASSALDFDDGHYEGGGVHLGSVIVPAVLAVAEERSSLRDLLTAVIVGYEVAIRAGYLMAPRAAGDTYHASGGPASLGAACAAARLLSLDAGGIFRALRIAAAHMPIARLQLPMVKESIGWGATTAVSAAYLAAEGFDGMPSPIPFGPVLGLPPTCFDEPAHASDPFVDSLGLRWHSAESYFKPYACCRAFHAAIDGLTEILAQQSWLFDEIESIEVGTLSAATSLNYLPPPSIEHAQFSFPWVMACAAVHGRLGVAEMAEAAIVEPRVLALASRVAVAGDAELDRANTREGYPAKITVTAHGSRISREVPHADGGWRRPWPIERLKAKFLDNAATHVGELEAKLLLRTILDGDELLPLPVLLRQRPDFDSSQPGISRRKE